MEEKKDKITELDENKLNDLNGGLDGYPPYLTPPVYNPEEMYQKGRTKTIQERCNKCGCVIKTYKGTMDDVKPKMQTCPHCNQKTTPLIDIND